MSYPPPPGSAPAPSGKPRLRGRIPLRLALIFGIVGIAAIVVGAVIGFKAGLSKVDDFHRVSLSEGQSIITFNSGDYVAYYEAPGFDTSSGTVPVPALRITNNDSGETVDGHLYGNRSDDKLSKLTYDYDGHHGAAVYEFTIADTGKYTVETAAGSSGAASDADLAFGKSIATGLATGGIIAVVGVLLFIAAIILLIIGLVKRRRHKKELATAGAYGSSYPPPPGYGAPGGGYPQQGGYQAPPSPGYQQGGQPGYGQQGGQGYPPPPPPSQS